MVRRWRKTFFSLRENKFPESSRKRWDSLCCPTACALLIHNTAQQRVEQSRILVRSSVLGFKQQSLPPLKKEKFVGNGRTMTSSKNRQRHANTIWKSNTKIICEDNLEVPRSTPKYSFKTMSSDRRSNANTIWKSNSKRMNEYNLEVNYQLQNNHSILPVPKWRNTRNDATANYAHNIEDEATGEWRIKRPLRQLPG